MATEISNSINSIINTNTEDISLKGTKWTDEEEKQLLNEIAQNISKEKIAIIHKRNIGGISSRINEIAYRMFIQNILIDEIINKTKLKEQQILDFIEKKKAIKNESKTKQKKIVVESKPINIENEILEIKEQIKDINKNIDRILKLLE
jgi:hypothetical protein